MAKITRWYRAVCCALFVGSSGCTLPNLLRPTPPTSTWAENYDENDSSNSADSGKFEDLTTDDNAKSAAPEPRYAGLPPEPGVDSKQLPLNRKDMLIMPPPPKPIPTGLTAAANEGDPIDLSKKDPKNTDPTGKPIAKDTKDMGVGKPIPPFLRQSPTATGEILDLGPKDHATERAVELSFRLAGAEAENKLMFARLRKLETDIEAKDKSLAESAIEVEQATAEIAKSRLELLSLRREVSTLRERTRKLEREDIETLRAVITGLEKILESTGRSPTFKE